MLLRFSHPVYDEINVNWYSPLIYDIYLDDDYVNNDRINNNSNCNNDVINSVLIDMLEVKCKENIEDAC